MISSVYSYIRVVEPYTPGLPKPIYTMVSLFYFNIRVVDPYTPGLTKPILWFTDSLVFDNTRAKIKHSRSVCTQTKVMLEASRDIRIDYRR